MDLWDYTKYIDMDLYYETKISRRSKMIKKPFIALCLIFFGILFMNSVSAQLGGNLTVDDSESATIQINISSKVMVDITPASFSWSPVDPGGVGDNTTELNGYYAIQIENIGSQNITHVWFNASYPTSNPFGSGSNAYVNAGNFVVLSKNTSSDEFWFINIVEYNTTAELVYVKDPQGNMPPNANKYVYGRYHNSSNEYFWMIDNNTVCNVSGTTMYIGNVSHSKTQTGTTNFNSTTDVESFTLTNYEGWGYADITDGPLNGLCVAVKSDCTQVFFSKWNADAPFHLCSNVNYAYDYNETGTPTYLVPGDSFAMKIKVYVPFGIYEGQAQAGTIWAIVNNN